MNRGRHKSNKIDKTVKLAKQYGAQYPEAWKSSISYKNLIDLINTQKKECGFNNLHIFETNFASSDITKGGFNWNRTEEGFYFWQKVLNKLYCGIFDYKRIQNRKIIKIKLK